MWPVSQGLLDRRPLFLGITPMAQLWANYSDIDREQRLRVTRAIAQMSDEEVKRLKQYMLMRRLADAKIAEFLAQGGAGASLPVHYRFPFQRPCQTPRRTIPSTGPWHSLLMHRKQGLADPFVVLMRGTSLQIGRVAVGEPIQQKW